MDNLNKHQILFKAVSSGLLLIRVLKTLIMSYLLKMFPEEKRKFVKHVN